MADRPDAVLHFMLTSRRAALVVLSPSGDGEQRDLPEEPLVVEDPPDSWLPLGRQDVRSGDLVWGVTRSRAPLYQELCQIVGLPLGTRLMELARWNWQKGDVVYASSLLFRAMQAGEHHAPVIFNLRPVAGDGIFPDLVQVLSALVSEPPDSTHPVSDEPFPDLVQALSALVSEQPDSTRLVELCEHWKLGFEQQGELLEQILAFSKLPAGWAAPLYRSVHDQVLEKEKDDVKKTEWSLDFADYLISNDLAPVESKLPRSNPRLRQRFAVVRRRALRARGSGG